MADAEKIKDRQESEILDRSGDNIWTRGDQPTPGAFKPAWAANSNPPVKSLVQP